MTDVDLVRYLFDYDAMSGDLLWRVERRGRHSPCVGRSATFEHCMGYRLAPFRGAPRLAHRLIWLLVYGYWPKEIDHINRDKSDNRLENLRECDRSQNNGNIKQARSDSKTGVRGVCWSKAKKKYKAEICFRGKKKHLGYFRELDEAKLARLGAEKKIFGEFSPK